MLRRLLLETAAPQDSFSGLVVTGGMLDLAAAAQAANALPRVSITAPMNGAFIANGESVILEATVADGDGTVTRIEAWAGSELVATDSFPMDGWQLHWTTPPIGRNLLTLVAVDDDGNRITMREPFRIDYGILIRDDLDVTLADIDGDWTERTLLEGHHGETALELVIPSGEESVVYNCTIPVSGSWAVEARWPESSLNSMATNYLIDRSGGTNSFIINQRESGGAWHELGTWSFEQDEAVAITISPTSGVFRVYADAIRLRQVPVRTRRVSMENADGTILWTLPDHEGVVEDDWTTFDSLDPDKDHVFNPQQIATGPG